jgi:hypothetical protein
MRRAGAIVGIFASLAMLGFRGLVWLVAFVIELSSGLGLYVSTAMWNAPRNARDDLVLAKIDALSAKFDRVDEKRNSLSEMPISLDEKAAITLAEPPSKPEKVRLPKPVAEDGEIVHSQFTQRKALIENRDPSAVPQFADPVLLEKLRALGGTYQGSLRELSGLLGIANSTLHKKLTQAQAAGKIAWRATKGKGTSIELIEGVAQQSSLIAGVTNAGCYGVALSPIAAVANDAHAPKGLSHARRCVERTVIHNDHLANRRMISDDG